jgi:hypothetical protein
VQFLIFNLSLESLTSGLFYYCSIVVGGGEGGGGRVLGEVECVV